MSDPPTPEELEAMRNFAKGIRSDLMAQAEAAASQATLAGKGGPSA